MLIDIGVSSCSGVYMAQCVEFPAPRALMGDGPPWMGKATADGKDVRSRVSSSAQ